jgi:hypothetical protein
MRPGKPPDNEPEAARLRRLVAEWKQEQEEKTREQKEAKAAADKLWREKREKFAPKVVPLAKAEILRQARQLAQRGQTSLSIDLGVDEGRLRTSSSEKELLLAEAVLAQEPMSGKPWPYIDRVGWLLQSADGQQPSPCGEELMDALREMGFISMFLPYFIQDNAADPFCNARLEIQW